MRVLIMGNSGSGKSWRARELAQQHALAHLDLDTIAFEPDSVAVPRPLASVMADLHQFTDTHAAWVIEGCYGDVIEAALPLCTQLLFMNPGLATCVANNHARPWEPHKHPTRLRQEKMLPFLLEWVHKYYERDDRCSYAWHRRVFDAWPGAKLEVV